METASSDLPTGFANLATALAKAQLEFKDPLKNRQADIKSDKGNYRYAYADLPAVYDSVRPALAKNGLAVTHDVAMENGRVFVSTRLLHSSGEQIGSTLSWNIGQKIQELGSSITFLKRYTLCALVGVAADEDDDANVADQKPATTAPKTRTQDKPATTTTTAAALPADARGELSRLLVDVAKKVGATITDDDQVDTLERAITQTRVSSLPDAKVAEMLPKFRAPTEPLLKFVTDKLTSAGLVGAKPGTARPSN